MKVIDIFNKIANGEEIPPFSVYDETFYINNDYYNYIKSCDNEIVKWAINEDFLNQEIKFVEEEKKIPEKLPYYSMEKIQKAKNKDEWREERITLLEKRVDDLHIKMNELLDYLKSKGDE